MADSHTTANTGRFEVRVTDSHFAWVRTRLALERTIMSWLRTAVALIGFGFAIVQYLEHLQQFFRSPPRLSSRLSPVPGPRADLMRHYGTLSFYLAVLVVHSLSVG
jgi:uncharacterized membrane protein YidH (DUF202 family)